MKGGKGNKGVEKKDFLANGKSIQQFFHKN